MYKIVEALKKFKTYQWPSSLHNPAWAYLLAGQITGDWNIKSAPNTSIKHWISAIPAGYNSQFPSWFDKLNLSLELFRLIQGQMILVNQWC